MNDLQRMLRSLHESQQALLQAIFARDKFLTGASPALTAAMASSKEVSAYLKTLEEAEEKPVLLPCPFCGASGEQAGLDSVCVNPDGDSWAADGKYRWSVRCGPCATSTSVNRSKTDAIAAWNTRQKPKPSAFSQPGDDSYLVAVYWHGHAPSLSSMKTTLKGIQDVRVLQYLKLIELGASNRKNFINLFDARIKELTA